MRRALLALGLLASAHAQAATIYLCRAYNGSQFWAQQTCARHNALIVRIESVADVPWDQQVKQAEGHKPPVPQDTTRDTYCKQLYAELRSIEKRYEAGYWQDVPVVNRDQARTRALRGDLAANQCSMR